MSFELVGVKLVAQDYSQYMTQVGNADKATSGFGSTSANTFKQMPGLADIATGALHKIGEVAVDVFLKAGQAAVGFFKDSISAAGDFESGMNKFSAVAGDSLAEAGLSLKDFRDQFIQIGKELPVSTSEVQDAAIEMVKGGIEPATIAAGGLKQVIQFAAAADLDLAEASTIAAKALGGWTDASASAQEKADFLAHSTDLLAKAANASTVDVDELALGLYNVQGTAKSFGVNFDEVVTTLAEVSPAFASSADAGTAFSSFIKSLQPKTKPAIAALKSIGLYTDEAGSAFYDANGKFVGMQKASELLSTALGGLTDAQKAAIMPQIFGDGLRIASELADKGAAGFDAMAASMAKQSGVAEMAAQKQKGFNTALDNAKGSFEALQITAGTKLLPVLTNLLNNIIAPGINIITDLVDVGQITQQTFDKLTPTMQGVATGITNAFSVVQGAVEAVQKKFATFQEVIRLWDSGVVSHKTLLQALGISPEIAGVIDQVISKISGFVQYLGDVKTKVEAAFQFDGVFGAIDAVVGELAKVSPAFALIKGAAEAAFPAVQQIVSDAFGIIETVIAEHGDKMLADVQGVWDGIWDAVELVLKPLQELVATVFGIVADAVHDNGDDIVPFIKETWDSIFEIIDTALKLISGIVAGVLIIVNEFIKEHGETIKNIITNVWTIIKNIIGGALDIIKGLLTAALKVFQGDWEGAWTAIREMSESVVKRLWEIIKAGLDLIANLFGTTLQGIADTWAHNWETFKGAVKSGIDGLVGFFTSIPGKVADVGAAIVQSIWDGLKGKWDDFVADLQSKLEELRNMLPFSEPKDPNSPLRGLQKSGYAMVEQIQIGIDSFGPLVLPAIQTRSGGSLGDLLGSSGVWGNSGGSGGGGGSPWGNGLVAGIATPALAGLRSGAANITNNQQRSVALTYNTAVAPPVSQSYAMSQALVGGF